ncbi:ATP-binding protein [Streptomyces sp. UH6]|uniref:ATP-binding protein n=1 Tax=Streptomyces sp. UH6 TaxID=2748379 RepID=UPI0015D46F57|nr:ATP-binding protein [Streptomyces sp. UH6]NYV72819.1 sensor histidine kinase [Streptomyces sp. UH6]
MHIVVTVLSALAFAGLLWGWRMRRRWQAAARETGRLARQQQAVEHALDHLSQQAIPRMRQTGGQDAPLHLPGELAGTAVGRRLAEVAARAGETVQAVVYDVRADARAQAEQARAAAVEEVQQVHAAVLEEMERVRSTAVSATRAAVRSVSSSLVGMAAKVGRQVSEGVRRHQDDGAFETLVGIDHTVQQMLLAAQGWTVLAGGTLTRRWPATPLTDVVRAAMGYVGDYQRVRAQELPTAVTSRAVGPVVHTLALLLDNGLRYSPPNATVQLSFQEGHHGVTVLVDDAGLRMTPEQLDQARDILSGNRREDLTELGEHPQTGFRVAAALAQAYGFRVDLEAPNAFLGTRALLFIPKNLLTAAPAPQPEPEARHVAEPSGVPMLAPVPSVPGQADAQVSPRTTASGLTMRTRNPASAAAPPPRPRAVEPGRPSVIAAWAAGTRRARDGESPLRPSSTDEGHSS